MTTFFEPPRDARAAAIAAAVLAVVTSSVAAQDPFRNLKSLGLPFRDDHTGAIAYGDVDGDGDQDLVIGNLYLYAQNRLYLNDGHDNFAEVTETHLPIRLDYTWDVALGDLDGDGDLDLIVANSQEPSGIGQWNKANRVLLNDGTGHFTDAPVSAISNSALDSFSIDLADIDGDGDLDAVSTEFDLFGFTPLGFNVYRNDGLGSFSSPTTVALPIGDRRFTDLALSDVDGDQDIDMLVSGRTLRLYRNDGTGVFTDDTASSLSVSPVDCRAIAVGDIDADGDIDIALGNGEDNNAPLSSEPNSILINDGTGVFSDESATRLPHTARRTQDLGFGDVDQDGDLDLFAVHEFSGTTRPQIELFLNDGSGSFADATVAFLPSPPQVPRIFRFEELKGLTIVPSDTGGVSSLAVANAFGRNRLLRWSPQGRFEDVTELGLRLPESLSETSHQLLGDFNGDGFPDLVRRRFDPGVSRRSEVLLNDGDAGFTAIQPLSLLDDKAVSYFVALDADVDGDLDLFVGGFNNSSNIDRLLLNDGLGAFTDVTGSRLPGSSFRAVDGVTADIDSDGDPDLLAVNYTGVQVLVNDGQGSFTDETARFPQSSNAPRSIVVGDIDGDGDPDAILSESDARSRTVAAGSRLLLNDGSGHFTDAGSPVLGSNPFLVTDQVLADINEDGALDLVTLIDPIRGPGQPPRIFQIFVNDGAGGFTNETETRGTLYYGRAPKLASRSTLAVEDMDSDGFVDIVVLAYGTSGGQTGHTTNTLVFSNSGTGTFRYPDPFWQSERILIETHTSLAVGDLDRDGDPDLLIGTNLQDTVWLNLTRQTHLRGQPQIGDLLEFEVHSKLPVPRLADTAIPFLALAPATIPTPFGTIGIEPTLALPLPPFVIPQATGVGRATYPIPADPTISGIPLYVQSLISPFPLEPQVTNTAFRRLR